MSRDFRPDLDDFREAAREASRIVAPAQRLREPARRGPEKRSRVQSTVPGSSRASSERSSAEGLATVLYDRYRSL